MPNKLVKSYAKKSKKSPSSVEKKWDQAKAQVNKEYPKIKKDSGRYYALVNAITRKMLKIEDVEEEASTTTTTANIGAGMSGAYKKRMLAPSKKDIKSDDLHNKKVLKSFTKG